MEDIESLGNKVSNLEQRIVVLEALFDKKTAEVSVALVKKPAVKEFVLQKKPSDDVQKALVIAYYLEKQEGMKSFNVEDLARYFRLAKEPTPQNLNDKINLNIKKGHMMEAGEKKENKKAWVITNTGELFVEDNFKKNK